MFVGFLGTGNMGGALAKAVCKQIGAPQVMLANKTRAKAQALADECGCAVAQENAQLAQMDVIFLCVKPQMMGALLEELAPVLNQRIAQGHAPVLVSIAAGLSLATLRGYLSGESQRLPFVRVMPNTPVEIGQGMVAVCGAEDDACACVCELLGSAGRVARMEERLMDSFSAVAGCSPAFVYMMIEAMADGAVRTGLPRAQAQMFAAQAVLGSAAMVLESGKHPGALKDAVCSPGGSTIAGVAALEEGAFRATMMQAIMASFQRNQELG